MPSNPTVYRAAEDGSEIRVQRRKAIKAAMSELLRHRTKADQQLLLTKRIAEQPGSNAKGHQGHHGHHVPDWSGAGAKIKPGHHPLAPLRQKPVLELDIHDHFNQLVPKTAAGIDSPGNRLDVVRSPSLASRQGSESNGGSKRDEVMLRAVNNSMAMYEGNRSHRVSDAEASRARMLMRNQRRDTYKEDMALYNDSPANVLENLATFPKILPDIRQRTPPRSSGHPQSRWAPSRFASRRLQDLHAKLLIVNISVHLSGICFSIIHGVLLCCADASQGIKVQASKICIYTAWHSGILAGRT